jgi:hypothetical protein
MSPELWAALIENVGIPELMAWLADLRAKGVTVVSDADALALLGMDADAGNAAGKAALDSHTGA